LTVESSDTECDTVQTLHIRWLLERLSRETHNWTTRPNAGKKVDDNFRYKYVR